MNSVIKINELHLTELSLKKGECLNHGMIQK
jgi:hypothetical protein